MTGFFGGGHVFFRSIQSSNGMFRRSIGAVHKWTMRACRTDADSRAKIIASCLFDIDPTWLFLSLIPGGIGFVLFVYGKKQGRWPHLVAGLLFMAYPYVATTVVS